MRDAFLFAQWRRVPNESGLSGMAQELSRLVAATLRCPEIARPVLPVNVVVSVTPDQLRL